MKVLVTGANGQLGHDVIERLKKNGIECRGIDIKELDITDEQKVMKYLIEYHPDAVIHCAAYTAVDKAEDEKELCNKVNVLGTRYITKACKVIDSKMIYISTDYIFNGSGDQPFEVTDHPDPINNYGYTKYMGELEVQSQIEKYYIVRISWVFGIHGHNFVKTMLSLGKEKPEIFVVDDQIGSPTYTYDLARLLSDMIQTDKYGIYHATNEGYCSWYEFACEIFKQAEINVKVTPVKTENYPSKARRPQNSRLSKKSLEINHFQKLPKYQDAISCFLESIKQLK